MIEAVTAALPEMQSLAESLMVESCTVTPVASVTADPLTGADVTTYGPATYVGPCKVQQGLSTRDVTLGEGPAAIVPDRLDLPVATSSLVRIGDVATMADGRKYRVTGLHDETWQTARRLPVERVS